MRVLTYNIHKGFSFGQKFIIEQLKEAIHSTQADLVFLQEVLGEHNGHSKSEKKWVGSQLEYLADTAWSHHAYGKNAVYSEGHHGNAIMSLWPFVKWDNIDVSTNTLERRGLLHAEIAMQPQNLHVICVHLNLFEKSRQWQIEKIAERIDQAIPHSAPLIVAGDFNDWRERGGGLMEELLEVKEAYKHCHGEHARTFPSWFPFLPLDRMYVRGLQIESAQCLDMDPWHRLSDHSALLVTLHPL